MNKIVNRFDLLFDGLENDLVDFSINITLDNKESIEITIEDVEEKNLEDYQGPEDLKIISNNLKLIKSPPPFEVYKGIDNLMSYYSKKSIGNKRYLLIFSFGEFQPARYKIYFEGYIQLD